VRFDPGGGSGMLHCARSLLTEEAMGRSWKATKTRVSHKKEGRKRKKRLSNWGTGGESENRNLLSGASFSGNGERTALTRVRVSNSDCALLSTGPTLEQVSGRLWDSDRVGAEIYKPHTRSLLQVMFVEVDCLAV